MSPPSPQISASRKEWRDGWKFLLACYMGAILASVPINTVGLFMGPLGNAFGWSRAEMSAAVPINGWLIALSAPFVGALVDRIGVRRVGLIGAVVLPAALACLSLIRPAIATYWGVWGVIAVAQITANVMIWTLPVPGRFAINRGTALAVVLLGNSTSGMLYPLFATYLIEHFGWRVAYQVTGASMFALCFPLIWLYFYDWRDLHRRGLAGEPAEAARGAAEEDLPGLTVAEASRTRQFWQLLLAVALGAGSAVALFVHIIPLTRSVGLAPGEAATAASALGIGTLVAKLVCGPLVDRISAPPLAAATMLFPVISCQIFLGASGIDVRLATLAAFMVGLGTGAELDMLGVLSSRMFGLRQFGRIYGIVMTSFQISLGAVPLLVGFAFDRTGNYDLALYWLTASLLGSATLFATLGRARFAKLHLASPALVH